MAKKAKKNAGSAGNARNAPASDTPKPQQQTLAAELEDEMQDGYASSTHTDTDNFEDAADGDDLDAEEADDVSQATASLSIDSQTTKRSTYARQSTDSAQTSHIDDRASLSRPVEEDLTASTPKPTESVFPGAISEDSATLARPTSLLAITAETNAPSSQHDSVAASSSSATIVASDTATKSGDSDGVDKDAIPLSSAEIRDNQPDVHSLILDEESAKAALPNEGDLLEKVPPSIGATSLLEPEETISNPFASGNPEDDPADVPRRFSAADTTSTNPGGQNSSPAIPDTPGAHSNHFSVVSLNSTADSNSTKNNTPALATNGSWTAGLERRNTLKTLSGDTDSEKEATTPNGTVANYDFLLARLESQNKAMDDDPKAIRASLDGAVKLRENFEKLRDQGQHQRRSRSESQNKAFNEEGESSADAAAAHASNANDHQHSTNGAGITPSSSSAALTGKHTRTSVSESGDSVWDGPPAEEIADEAIDWEFWGDVMSNYQQVARTQPRQLSRAIQAGIPAALRGMMWQLMSSSKNEEMEIIYAFYLKQSSSHEKAIRRDLNRTFPEQSYFQDGKGIGQENLFNVIKAYSLYDPEVGYCQGMQFIVGPLLLNMPDEEAFSTFVRLMKSYGLRGHFTPNMPALQLRLFQYDRLLEDFLPLLYKHLVRQGVKSSMYASQWFMTLFSYRFPLELVYRILDSVFAEGVEALFRFAIGLMKKNEEVLLQMNFDQLVNFLKMELFECYAVNEAEEDGEDRDITTGPRTGDGMGAEAEVGYERKKRYRTNEFVRDAFEIKITSFVLDGFASEFDMQVRAANAHRREVEALRLVNKNLLARVKSLEEQLNSVNSEHVQMVKDVVLAKIAREEMAEELVKYKMMYAEAVLQADQDSQYNNNATRRSSKDSHFGPPSPNHQTITNTNPNTSNDTQQTTTSTSNSSSFSNFASFSPIKTRFSN